MSDSPQSLIEAVRYFADPQVCFEAMLAAKWPDGKVTCPKCDGTYPFGSSGLVTISHFLGKPALGS